MKFSLKWLADFTEVKAFFKEPDLLAQRLTQSGLEVESVEDQKARFQNIVVAKIESVKKHPKADRLTLCEVFDGSKTYSIVCGAKNHKAGDKVVLARPGAVLPGDFTIKKARIRGEESEGMLAGRGELGFESEEEGIWILPVSAEVGKSFSEYLGCNDVIFDIAVPPNRSDCLSHKGLAREISCLFDLPFSVKDYSLNVDKSLSVKKTVSVEVKDSRACPRYCGRLIEGVKIAESPDWLKERLKSLGLKSINNVVDITNFVLWDWGQPLHAFDRDQIRSLQVDSSQKGEKFLVLNESELALTGEELTIRDKDRVLALAGVIGGMDSAVTSQTKNIFIEAAYFAPEKTRKTVRGLGLDTDSSYRFMRGIDFTAVQEAMDLACSLIQKEAGGLVSGDFYDICESAVSPSKITIRLEDLKDRLGYPVESSPFQNWMKKLGCKVRESNNSFQVLPPSYRTDLKIKEDLIEEFARLEGYDKIPEHLPSLSGLPNDSDSQFLTFQKLISFLSGKGWYQVLNYSFCDPEYYRELLNDKFYLEELAGPPVSPGARRRSFSVNNPISQQFSLMKPLLAPDLIKNAVYNFRHNNKFGRTFELSPVFYQEGEEYQQELNLALICWGNPIDIWKNKNAPNIYYIKSVLESVFKAFGLKAYSWEPAEISFLHPRQTLGLTFKKQTTGFLGGLHPQILKKHKIPIDIALAEIQWEALSRQEKKPLKFKSFSQLLTVEKDLCFVIPPDKNVGHIQKEIKKSLGSLCEGVEVFDVYKSKGERSVSFRMFLKPEDKSWTDEQLNHFLNKAIETVQKKFSIHLKQGI